MSERIENAVVTAVGACLIFLSGWGFLALADGEHIEEICNRLCIVGAGTAADDNG